jgi:hypothetical protein
MDEWRFREVKVPRCGDIIMYNKKTGFSKIISWVVGRNHVSLAYSPTLQVEAHWKKGVVKSEIPKNVKNVRIFRPFPDGGQSISGDSCQRLKTYMESHLIGRRYSFFRGFLHWCDARWFGSWWTRKLGRVKKSAECSLVVAESYSSILGFKWITGFGLDPAQIDDGKRFVIDEKELSYWSVDPGDIFKNILWRLI